MSTEQANKRIADNRLIAEFMGLPTTRKKLLFSGGYAQENIHYKYHDSWDWLMNVVEKIEGIKNVGAVVISRDHCWIQSDREPINYENEIVHPDLCQPNKITAVYSAVLQFIQWHNQNKTV